MHCARQAGVIVLICVAACSVIAFAEEPATADTPPVATAPPDVPAADSAEQVAPPAATFTDWSEHYRTSVENRNFDEAVDAATHMVDIALEQAGEGSPELLRTTLLLAGAQRGAKQYDKAAGSYIVAITMIENEGGIFAEELIDPLIDLGSTLMFINERERALESFLRARHVSHRRMGLFNTAQIPIVDHLTEVYVASGELSDAMREQKFAYRIVERDCNEDEACMVQGTYKMAHWYSRIGRNSRARSLYKQALTALEKAYGENDLRLVEALQGIAQTYSNEGFRRKEGERSLIRAIEIYDQQPFGDSVEHANSLARLGDWYTLSSDYDEAQAAYERAWQVIIEQGGTSEQANNFFARPMKLRYDPPYPTTNDPAWHYSKIRDASVVVEFTVNARGRVDDATVLESGVSRRVHHEVRDSVKRARYRPRLHDGSVVDTQGVRIRQTFDYVRSLPDSDDLQASRPFNPACPNCEI